MTHPPPTSDPTPVCLRELRAAVRAHHASHRRDLPWRATSDPYAVLVSEVMLQQTQVSRVGPKYAEFLDAFPTLDSLAAAPLQAVLERWQGLGYNRRAVSLKRTAERVAGEFGGVLPGEPVALATLPGIGPATAAAIATYAFGAFAPFIETNVRAVFLHHCFAEQDDVPDRELMPLVEASWDREDPREWGYALMDYGSWLKRATANPARRSRHHTRQSPFEGSRRQKRARLLRAVMAAPGDTVEDHALGLGIDTTDVAELLEELEAEGFLARDGDGYSVA
jgi:A/G-specific adenine glycosylase